MMLLASVRADEELQTIQEKSRVPIMMDVFYTLINEVQIHLVTRVKSSPAQAMNSCRTRVRRRKS
jgi:hypothetical protein